MNNQQSDNHNDNALARHIEIIQGMKSAMQTPPAHGFHAVADGGLAELQKTTVSLMNRQTRGWGFANSSLRVKRRKIGNDLWRITVENPKTREVILEAQGHGDKVFAYEDNLARMAEALIDKDLVITTGQKD